MGLRRVTHDQRWWLHDAAASREAEHAALAAAAPHALMQRAGTSVARLALAIAPHARCIRVMAGPGNNGGDGLVAATWLHRAGRAVEVVLCADASRLGGDAQWAHAEALQAGVPIFSVAPPGDADLHIDALLGLGATRAVDGMLADAVARMNAVAAPVLAVDLPSGLPADTGSPAGAAVRATHTLSLLTLKPGLFTGHGRDLAGQVWFDDLDAAALPAAACAQLPMRPAPAVRCHASHKGSYGDVGVVGGAPGMAGAAWLAAQAALAAGAGRVYVSLIDDSAAGLLATRPELMAQPQLWLAPAERLRAATVVCGCGAGDAAGRVLPPLIAHAGRLVLDADALNAIAEDTTLLAQLQRRSARGAATVLTPHPLEAARLLGNSSAAVQADRLGAARAIALRCAAVVVLKGSGSIVAAPGRLPSINPTGNAALATPGTGDVLAGWIGGAWSALGASDPGTAFDAAVASVWRHGEAADRHVARGRRGPLSASALIDAMSEAT